MPQDELNNLVRIGKLKPEPPVRAELEGLLRSGSLRLTASAICPSTRANWMWTSNCSKLCLEWRARLRSG